MKSTELSKHQKEPILELLLFIWKNAELYEVVCYTIYMVYNVKYVFKDKREITDFLNKKKISIYCWFLQLSLLYWQFYPLLFLQLRIRKILQVITKNIYMNGYHAVKVIRKMDNLAKASIPIVAMTANAFEEDKKNAYAAGMDAHLAKPIDISKLMGTLTDILE